MRLFVPRFFLRIVRADVVLCAVLAGLAAMWAADIPVGMEILDFKLPATIPIVALEFADLRLPKCHHGISLAPPCGISSRSDRYGENYTKNERPARSGRRWNLRRPHRRRRPRSARVAYSGRSVLNRSRVQSWLLKGRATWVANPFHNVRRGRRNIPPN